MNAPTHSKRFEIWPVALTVFFTCLVFAVVGFAIWSGTQRVDLVSDDYYAQEVAYQQRIDHTRNADALPHPATIRWDSATTAVHVAIPGGGSADGELWLYRPSNAGLDQRLPLALDADGAQALTVAALRPGLWKARLAWKQAGTEYYKEETLVIE